LAKIKENPISYMLKEVPIDTITVWDEAQARKLNDTDIDSLAKSIQSEGLQNPPRVQRNGPNSYLLMAGQRRLAALKKVGSHTIPVLISSKESECGIEDAKAISVIENLHRQDMSLSEMVTSCQFLVEKMGKTEAAKALGIKPQTLREYLGFGVVPDGIKEMVPKVLSRRDAIRICKVIVTPSKATETIQRISKLNGSQKKRYLDALEQLGSTAEHTEILKLANSFRARQNISMKLSKSQAKGLSKISRENNLEPAEFAQKIVADYLSRKGFQ
jgi:ParB family transcriptional regulator, chromosome partitioning protein